MDLGAPASYEVLSAGTPVYSSDEQQIGKVSHVLAAADEDVFDGIVIGEHIFGEGIVLPTPTTFKGSSNEACCSSSTEPVASDCRSRQPTRP